MKKLIVAIFIILIYLFLAAKACNAQTQNINIGFGFTSKKHSNVHLGADFNMFNNSVRLTPEFFSMMPNTSTPIYFGGRAGVVLQRFAIQLGYYYTLYSTDKNEFTKGKNHFAPGGFVSYDVYVNPGIGGLTIQAGYLEEIQILFTFKAKL